MKRLGYYNGEFGALENMKVDMTDRCVYFGDGVYEAAVANNSVIYALDDHIKRLYRSMAKLRIEPPMSEIEMADELNKMLAHMDDKSVLCYWQVSRATGYRAHNFIDGKSNLMMMLTPFTFPDISKPIKCITRDDTRFLHCDIKTINLIPSVMAYQAAKEADCYEAILHRGERVTECSRSNVSILKGGKLITAPADNLILAGIARSQLIEACKNSGIEVCETPYTVSELMDADEVFVTSTTSFIRRVVEIDGKPVGGRDEENYLTLKNYMWNRFIAETEGK